MKDLTGDNSWHLSNYGLPVTDVCHSRRNFPGYVEYPNMSDVQGPGTTDTRGGKNNADINYKSNGIRYDYDKSDFKKGSRYKYG